MSKIICDVCGTSYPETASQCPICGCVRSGDPITVAGDTNEADIRPASSYTHVKGGRFSKSNVKKRNAGKPIYNTEPIVPQKAAKPKSKKGEKGLIAVVIVLLLLIAAVVVYIALSIFNIKLPFLVSEPNHTTGSVDTQIQQTTTTSATTTQSVCESLEVSDSVIRFQTAGAAQLLNVKAFPKDSNLVITFSSSKESVATVDEHGKITAVGNGEATITIRCGDKSAQCKVICDIPEETTAPPVTEPEYTKDDLTFADNGYGYEYTIPFSQGSYNPYKGNIPAELVEFTSNDETVATVAEDGLITFVGSGRAIITAKYNDWEIQCIVTVF